MKCEEYEILINNKIDGEISFEEDNELSKHLESCSHCSDEAEALLNVFRISSSIKNTELSPEHKEKLWLNISPGLNISKLNLPKSNGQPVNGYHKKNITAKKHFPVYRYAIAAVFIFLAI